MAVNFLDDTRLKPNIKPQPTIDLNKNTFNSINSTTSNLALQNVGKNRAVLLLFKPSGYRTDEIIRPHIFNFDINTVNIIQNQLFDRPDLTSNVDHTSKCLSPLSIIPDPHGFVAKASIYDNKWTFLLIIHKQGGFSQYTNQNNNTSTRRMYIGICSDDPLSNRGLFSSVVSRNELNPHCQLIITRQIGTTHIARILPGHEDITNRLFIDSEILRYNEQLFNPDTYYSLDPSSYTSCCANGTDGFGNNEMVVVNDLSDSLNVSNNKMILTQCNNPINQMKGIVNSIDSTRSQLSYDLLPNAHEYQGSFISPNEVFNSSLLSSIKTDQVALENSVNSAMSEMATGYLTIDNLFQTYCPEIIITQTSSTVNQQMESMDHSILTPNNIFSSVVSSTVPSLLSKCNLSEIAFQYNSHHNAWQIMHASTISEMTQEQIKHAIGKFQFFAQAELFNVLLAGAGAFDLQVTVNMIGKMHIILNFYDYETHLPKGTTYQHQCDLGGLTSPLLGNNATFQTNAVQFTSLVSGLSEAYQTFN